jgi:hypothetical protein
MVSMTAAAALRKNLLFWHWYPELLVRDLTPQQLAWQPESHDTSIAFAIWHAYRAEDDLLHGIVMQRPSVFASQGWAERLPVAQAGATPFGNGLSREQIGALRLDVGALLSYAKAVGESELAYLDSVTEEDAAAEVKLPFFTGVYQHVDAMSRLEAIAFFAIGHTSEHLGEVQFLKGLMGMKGAPL